jgi:hypothetical protein
MTIMKTSKKVGKSMACGRQQACNEHTHRSEKLPLSQEVEERHATGAPKGCMEEARYTRSDTHMTLPRFNLAITQGVSCIIKYHYRYETFLICLP